MAIWTSALSMRNDEVTPLAPGRKQWASEGPPVLVCTLWFVTRTYPVTPGLLSKPRPRFVLTSICENKVTQVENVIMGSHH